MQAGRLADTWRSVRGGCSHPSPEVASSLASRVTLVDRQGRPQALGASPPHLRAALSLPVPVTSGRLALAEPSACRSLNRLGPPDLTRPRHFVSPGPLHL